MTEASITETLFRSMNEFATSLPVAWPGVVNTDKINHNHLRVQMFRNAPSPSTFQIQRYTGTMQVDVFWKNGSGTIDAESEASRVAQHFPRGRRISGDGVLVKIEDQPYAAGPLYEDGWVQIPVNIRWTAWVRA